jgi:multimeric flavodoxin WrbA
MFDWIRNGKTPAPRKGMPSPRLDEFEFKRRFRAQFQDHAFDGLAVELEKIGEAAWQAYAQSRKAPRTQKAGAAFSDPDYELATDWIAAKDAISSATALHDDTGGPDRVLLINGASRSEHTCPSEMSKSYRLSQIAFQAFTAENVVVETLDLSRLVSEYGRAIHPCKTCFSTSPALCHWPCSCYPNYALGQVHDWMNEIYPMWVAAHGIMVVTPVNWYQPSSTFKLMMDRMVCADGGNPDPTKTHGKSAVEAKELELAGWDYPKHLAGRVFAVVAHGDAEGVAAASSAVIGWLRSMGLESAGSAAELQRYIGYWKPYATSHDELDVDTDLQEEVRIAARTLVDAVKAKRSGEFGANRASRVVPRQK